MRNINSCLPFYLPQFLDKNPLPSAPADYFKGFAMKGPLPLMTLQALWACLQHYPLTLSTGLLVGQPNAHSHRHMNKTDHMDFTWRALGNHGDVRFMWVLYSPISSENVTHIQFNRRSCRGRAVKTSVFHTGGPGSNPGPAVESLGKAFYLHCLVYQRRLYAVASVRCVKDSRILYALKGEVQ